MCLVYILGALYVVVTHLHKLPEIVGLVLGSAFEGHAAVGGFAGASVTAAMRYGVARGMFSNEAGLGSAPIVHSSAVTDHPARQAVYGIFEVFVDTIVVCLLTGFVVMATGVWQSGDTGAPLAAKAFETGLPGVWGDLIVTTGLILFAFSTVIGWSYYGETGAIYLFGTGASLPYRSLWILFVYLGATGSLHVVWDISDTLNGLMAVPNLVAVLGSLPIIVRLTREFFAKQR
jgi:AGCS family alanine or glycine:cation symporter